MLNGITIAQHGNFVLRSQQKHVDELETISKADVDLLPFVSKLVRCSVNIYRRLSSPRVLFCKKFARSYAKQGGQSSSPERGSRDLKKKPRVWFALCPPRLRINSTCRLRRCKLRIKQGQNFLLGFVAPVADKSTMCSVPFYKHDNAHFDLLLVLVQLKSSCQMDSNGTKINCKRPREV